jgi:hypothetical protein
MFKLNSRFRSVLFNFSKIPLNKCLVLMEEEVDEVGDRKKYSTMPLRHIAPYTGISKPAAAQVKKLLRLGPTERKF